MKDIMGKIGKKARVQCMINQGIAQHKYPVSDSRFKPAVLE
jgi:hypothetical protein